LYAESASFNTRLLQEETVTNPAIHTLMYHAFNCGAQGTNNGNVMSVADQLNPSRTQSFTYDGLNRLATANESRWGLGFVVACPEVSLRAEGIPGVTACSRM